MNCAQAYLKKRLPVVLSLRDEIEEPPSAGAPIAGMNRPLRNEISIRNVIGNRISRDWRSLSRLCGLRPFFYMHPACHRQKTFVLIRVHSWLNWFFLCVPLCPLWLKLFGYGFVALCPRPGCDACHTET